MPTVVTKRKQDERRNDGVAGRSPHRAGARPASSSVVAEVHSALDAAAGRTSDGPRLALQGPAISLPALPDADRLDRVAVVCDGVIDIAAALFNVSGRELRSPGRSVLAVSRVRQIAMYLAHVTLRLSMRDVGQGFGRDRTTVLYACHLIEDLREEEEFDDIVTRVEQVVMVAFGMRMRQD